MSLFGKEKEEKKEAGCGCSCGCDPAETKEAAASSTCCGEQIDGICCIKVLGSGCKNCHALYENALEAVRSMRVKFRNTTLRKAMSVALM